MGDYLKAGPERVFLGTYREWAKVMDGLLAGRFNYLQRIWQLRYFWFSLVKNDLSNRYRRSFLGIGWSLIRPLAMTFILCMVFAKLFHLEVAEYAPYLLIGMTLWQFFTESLLQGCHSFNLGRAYIRQQPVPLAIFPLRTMLGSGFHCLIALTLGLAFALYFKGYLHPLALLNLVPAILLLLMLGWFLAILSGVLHTHFPDTHNLLEIGLQILFYLTPILYRPESLGDRARLARMLEWNPLTSVLALFRSPILDGTPPAMHQVLVSLAFVSLVGVLAVALLRKLEETLVFWL